MIDTNTFLIDFINNNWMGLIMFYSIIKSIFPNSKVLTAIGEGVSNVFPMLKGRASANIGGYQPIVDTLSDPPKGGSGLPPKKE